MQGVRLHFVAPRPVPGTPATPANVALADATAARAFPLAQPVLDAGPGQPPIIARSAWAQGHAPPSHVPLYGTVKLAFVHHSETPNGYSAGEVPSILLSIFDYHRYVRDYFDIAYNFAVDAFGRIWEARAGGIDLPIVGAHAGGYNAESTGMVVLGSFMDVVPSPAAISALEGLLAWKLALHGVPALGRVTVEVAPYAAFYTRFRARRARVAAARRRAPRRRRDELPRQRLLRAASVDAPENGAARGLAGAGHDRRSGRARVAAGTSVTVTGRAGRPGDRQPARRRPDRTAADRPAALRADDRDAHDRRERGLELRDYGHAEHAPAGAPPAGAGGGLGRRSSRSRARSSR